MQPHQARLIVKNFGPIKEVDLDLRRTNVFIGEQGSGKSTIAKLISIFQNPRFYEDLNDFQLFFDKLALTNTWFYQDTLLEFETEDIKLKYYDNKFSIMYESLKFIESKNKFQDYNKKISAIRREFETFIYKPDPDKILENLDILEKIKINDKYTLMFPIFIPVDRLFISSVSNSLFSILSKNVKLEDIIIVFGEQFEFARNNLKKLYLPLLNINYYFSNNNDFIILKNGKELPLVFAASGFQSMIPICLVVEWNYQLQDKHNRALYFIEEPELNLFPTTQKKLINYLVSRCTYNNNELVITTHSPYILSAFNNLLFAYKVGQKSAEDKAEIAEIVPEESWVNPDEFNAFFVNADGTAHTIFDRETGMIAENELDAISEELAGEFDQLMDIYKTKLGV